MTDKHVTKADDMANPESVAAGVAGDVYYSQFGLTKREHFAAMIAQGFAANVGISCVNDEYANEAVSMADTLIEALNK